jgi:hypothetical protein
MKPSQTIPRPDRGDLLLPRAGFPSRDPGGFFGVAMRKERTFLSLPIEPVPKILSGLSPDSKRESSGRAADTREGQAIMKTKPIILILAIVTCLVLLAGFTGTLEKGQSTCVQPAQPAPVSIAKTPVQCKEVNGVRLA